MLVLCYIECVIRNSHNTEITRCEKCLYMVILCFLLLFLFFNYPCQLFKIHTINTIKKKEEKRWNQCWDIESAEKREKRDANEGNTKTLFAMQINLILSLKPKFYCFLRFKIYTKYPFSSYPSRCLCIAFISIIIDDIEWCWCGAFYAK